MVGLLDLVAEGWVLFLRMVGFDVEVRGRRGGVLNAADGFQSLKWGGGM
jgi:hypothetical protein